jgi:hypothetical protein
MCVKTAHEPISCTNLGIWMDRVGDSDSDTELWKKINVKKCPKCKFEIEKN